MTLIAQLCALCAVSTLMQMALPDSKRSGMRMIGGLLMLHLVISGARDIAKKVLTAQDLSQMMEVLMK